MTDLESDTEETAMKTIFTFGFGQTDPKTGMPLANCYTRVEADNLDAAKHLMVDRFGHRYPGVAVGNWAFDYPDEATAGVERYGLIEVDFESGMRKLRNITED